MNYCIGGLSCGKDLMLIRQTANVYSRKDFSAGKFKRINFPVLRYTTIPDCEYKDDVLKLLQSLVNILAIIKHFQIKIKEWLDSQNISTPSEDQILEVVRKNYDLTLKLQDSLDQYERYAEKPKHAAFFTSMVREVVTDTRKNIYYAIKEAHAAPQANYYLTPQ